MSGYQINFFQKYPHFFEQLNTSVKIDPSNIHKYMPMHADIFKKEMTLGTRNENEDVIIFESTIFNNDIINNGSLVYKPDQVDRVLPFTIKVNGKKLNVLKNDEDYAASTHLSKTEKVDKSETQQKSDAQHKRTEHAYPTPQETCRQKAHQQVLEQLIAFDPILAANSNNQDRIKEIENAVNNFTSMCTANFITTKLLEQLQKHLPQDEYLPVFKDADNYSPIINFTIDAKGNIFQHTTRGYYLELKHIEGEEPGDPGAKELFKITETYKYLDMHQPLCPIQTMEISASLASLLKNETDRQEYVAALETLYRCKKACEDAQPAVSSENDEAQPLIDSKIIDLKKCHAILVDPTKHPLERLNNFSKELHPHYKEKHRDSKFNNFINTIVLFLTKLCSSSAQAKYEYELVTEPKLKRPLRNEHIEHLLSLYKEIDKNFLQKQRSMVKN